MSSPSSLKNASFFRNLGGSRLRCHMVTGSQLQHPDKWEVLSEKYPKQFYNVAIGSLRNDWCLQITWKDPVNAWTSHDTIMIHRSCGCEWLKGYFFIKQVQEVFHVPKPCPCRIHVPGIKILKRLWDEANYNTMLSCWHDKDATVSGRKNKLNTYVFFSVSIWPVHLFHMFVY